MSRLQKIFHSLPRLPSKAERSANQVQSPWKICRSLSPRHYRDFVVGIFAWIMDAFDFFAVSVTLTRLGDQFQGRSVTALTTGITLTLLLRPVGALVFGLITDRYGRRWPLTANLVLIGLLALGTGFVQTFRQFLAMRALFGIMMGGIYGMATATALENMPTEARGLFSGLLQQGYAIGYLIAASVNMSLVAETDNWRSIFYLGAGLSFLIALLRAVCPESKVFVESRKLSHCQTAPLGRTPGSLYLHSLFVALKKHWTRFFFAVMLMTGFGFFSHGSQDLYPTYLEVTKGMSKEDSSALTIIGNCGAIVGGLFAGWVSQFLGRRLTIVIMCVWAAGFVPLWILPTSFAGLASGAFLIQFGVQGALGVVPIYLSEISPSGLLGVFTGLTYQLGSMISSVATQIEARAAELHQVTINGVEEKDYALVQAALIGSVAGYIIILISFGKEYRGKDFCASNPSGIESVENSGSSSDTLRKGGESGHVEEKDEK